MPTIDDSQTQLPARVTWFDCLLPSSIAMRCFDAARAESVKLAHVWITLRDRPTERTAIVSWSDSQSGCLGEQIWSLGRARAEDFCAISGERIRRGDLVFRPRKTTPPAINEHSVIAAHHVFEVSVSM
ncbi:hypothetical protein AWB77_05950 [Caballeronia fortuita]|uniref:Ribosomal protein S14 n=1 Tax=Caballeronia fortuita TaxID=1777138 RepID=A0A158DX71_9BURK|nr:DUF3331 domain-containing protein [Caballeronia fortuita]SAK99229.1 hypothetical protein AWB77_05950 [Caballeronia fortuita]